VDEKEYRVKDLVVARVEIQVGMNLKGKLHFAVLYLSRGRAGSVKCGVDTQYFVEEVPCVF
jgi:hypothetical protein